MFGFRYITFVGILMLLQHLREADSFALHTNEKRNAEYQDGIITQLSDKTISLKNVEEELQKANHDGEMAARAKRTTLTTTIDGKFTVHLIVSVKPAEQVVPPRVTQVGRLRTGGPVQSPAISRSCQNEYCDFAMELELLKQVTKPPVDSSGEIKEEEEANKNETRSEGRVRIPMTPAKRDSKFRSSRTHATTTRYPMVKPSSTKQVFNRSKIATETTTTRYYRTSSVSNRPSVSKQVLNRTGVGRYQSTRIPTNATRFSRIRTNTTARSIPLSIDSREEFVSFSEKRNENGPNKSRARQLNEGKSPSALSTRYQTTRIHRKKVADSDVSIGKNESTTTEISQVQKANNNISRSEKPECHSNVSQFDVPIFRNSVEHKNISSDEINVTTPAAEDDVTQMTISNVTFIMPIPLNRRIKSNVTQSDELNTDPVFIQNNATQSEGLPADIPLELNENLATTEETVLNPTETGVQAEMTDNPISINSEDPDSFPWEQIGDFEFQINPKSKQVVNIRLQTTTTTASYNNSVTKSYEEQGNYSSLNEPQGQQDNLDVELGTAATTLEIPGTTVIPTQTVITPTVKLPIPLNRRKPIDGTQSDRVETRLEPSRDIVTIPSIPARPMEIVELEQTAITNDTQTSTTQKPEIFTSSSEVTNKQLVNGFTETATIISVQQTTIPENSQTTEMNTSAEIETSEDEYRNTSIAEVIQMGSGPAIIPPRINRTEPKASESYVVEKINLESAREIDPVTSTASGIPIQTTTTSSPIPELSDPSEEFPWEQRHDYEVQVNPTTKEIVNIRLLTTTTHKPLVSNDHLDRTSSESLLTAEEQDELTIEIVSRILERNGKIRTLGAPRLRDKNFEKVDDGFFPGVKLPGTRVAVSSDQTNKNAAPPRTVPHNNNRDRTAHGRKPIFSHSTEDGVFYFRYANDDDPSNADSRNKKIDTDGEIRETDWNTRRNDVPVRDSPYFYYVQDGINSSALVKASCYVLFLVACVLVVL